MATTVDKIVRLIGETSSTLPEDVIRALASARRRETRGSSADVVLKTILDNCALANRQVTPLCQDTGTLAFYVGDALRRTVTPRVLKEAVRKATTAGYLRKNTIDPITGRSYDDNVCDGAPVIHYMPDYGRRVTLIMKGGGSENMSRQYSLPDGNLSAGRDLEGVRRCVLDAVVQTQGYGCAPGILGVCIGGDRASAYEVAKEQLLRPLDEKPTSFEKRLLAEANSLGVGPMGLGGKTTLLGVKVATLPRVPASFFVTVAYVCWACRRRSIVL